MFSFSFLIFWVGGTWCNDLVNYQTKSIKNMSLFCWHGNASARKLIKISRNRSNYLFFDAFSRFLRIFGKSLKSQILRSFLDWFTKFTIHFRYILMKYFWRIPNIFEGIPNVFEGIPNIFGPFPHSFDPFLFFFSEALKFFCFLIF